MKSGRKLNIGKDKIIDVLMMVIVAAAITLLVVIF